MLPDQALQFLNIMVLLQRAHLKSGLVQPGVEIMLLVQDIHDAAGHARREVFPGIAENHDPSAGHILAAVVADAFHHGAGAGVSHTEALSRHAGDEGLARSRAVQGDIPDDDVFIRPERAPFWRIKHQLSAGQAFSETVVAVSLQAQGQPLRNEGAEGLSASAVTADHIAVLPEAVAACAGDLRPEERAEGPVRAGDPYLQFSVARALQRRPQLLQQQAVVLGLGQAEAVNRLRGKVRHVLPIGVYQQGGEIHGLGAVRDALFPHGEQIAAAYQLIDGPDADRRHALPQFLRHEEHEVHHIFRLSGKPRPQLRILCRDAHRAGVQVADAHHAASQGNERRCRKAEFLRTQHTGHRHIPPGHELAVGFDHDLLPQTVLHECLVGFGDAQLPGEAGIVDGRAGRRAGPAVVTGDQHHLCARLRDAAGDGPHARLRNQLDADAGIPVGVFQIENQLGQILDGIDIMMGRRTHQRDAGRGAAGSGDPGIDLASGQVAAFSGFRALCHLDLQLLRAVQIRAGHAEAPRGDLLDGRAVQRVLQAVRGLSALAGV